MSPGPPTGRGRGLRSLRRRHRPPPRGRPPGPPLWSRRQIERPRPRVGGPEEALSQRSAGSSSFRCGAISGAAGEGRGPGIRGRGSAAIRGGADRSLPAGMAIRYPMAVGLNKGYKVTKNVSKPRQCRRRGVSMRRARAGPAGTGAGPLPLRSPPAGGGCGQGPVAAGVRASCCRGESGVEPGAAGDGPPIRLRPRSPAVGGRAAERDELRFAAAQDRGQGEGQCCSSALSPAAEERREGSEPTQRLVMAWPW